MAIKKGPTKPANLQARISRLMFLVASKASKEPSNLALNTAIGILNHAYMIANDYPSMAEKLYAKARNVARSL